jgi:hypothetical protein
MTWISILAAIIPLLPKLMKIAEEAFDEIPESGVEKKRMVMDAVESLVNAVTVVNNGKSEVWAKIKGPISVFIDLACTLLFRDDDKDKGTS